uniref:Uncharacterized protein n=1 Tax=Schistosoma haematobium TaxID=6185 RepID=A0A095AJS3_SCHHA
MELHFKRIRFHLRGGDSLMKGKNLKYKLTNEWILLDYSDEDICFWRHCGEV